MAPSVHLISQNGSMDTPVSAEPPSSLRGLSYMRDASADRHFNRGMAW